MRNKKNIAIIGIGRWGKNLLREFHTLGCVYACCHTGNLENAKKVYSAYPHIRIVSSYEQVLADPGVYAVVLATPITTHAQLAHKALVAGKHVFVEKPLAQSVNDARRLIEIARRKKRTLFVGHVFSYHPIFTKIRGIINKESVIFAKFEFEKFGTFKDDIIWNLLPHEVGLALEIFGNPTKMTIIEKQKAISSCDILSVNLEFSRKRACLIDINRVARGKRRNITLITKQNVYRWEENKLYKLDKRKEEYIIFYETKKSALEAECQEFLKCISEGVSSRTDGIFGFNVVSVLSKLQSIRRRG